MTESEVDAMLKEWEQLGYDTTGFNLGLSDTFGEEGEQGQSRSVWPNSQDMLHDRKERAFRVSIPDRKGKLVLFFECVLKKKCSAFLRGNSSTKSYPLAFRHGRARLSQRHNRDLRGRIS
jgi:hypothetical protein